MTEHSKQVFSLLEHSGDLKIQAIGQDWFEALANASIGLASQITELDTVDEREQVPVAVEGDSDSSRAIALLNEIVYLAYGRGWLTRRVSRLTVCSHEGCRTLDAILIGESLDPKRHRIRREIKAVTYHDFSLRREHNQTVIEFVCDL